MLDKPASAVNWAQNFILPVLRPGAAAIDATAGNGRDTMFMASAISPHGRLYSFDIQEEALSTTYTLLQRAGLADIIKLINDGHENALKYIKEPVAAVMFNLGYLPGGDRSITTRAETTLQGIRACLGLLQPGGRMSIIIYTGHPGAQQEREVVESEALNLDQKMFNVMKLTFWNRIQGAPVLIFIERAGVPDEGMAS